MADAKPTACTWAPYVNISICIQVAMAATYGEVITMGAAATADVPDVLLPSMLVQGTPAVPGTTEERHPSRQLVCVSKFVIPTRFRHTPTAATVTSRMDGRDERRDGAKGREFGLGRGGARARVVRIGT